MSVTLHATAFFFGCLAMISFQSANLKLFIVPIVQTLRGQCQISRVNLLDVVTNFRDHVMSVWQNWLQ